MKQFHLLKLQAYLVAHLILFFTATTVIAHTTDPGPLTAHSNLFIQTTHGGLEWTPENLLGKNLLILHSYHENENRTANINKGIQKQFIEAGINVRYWVEYLDSKRFPYASNTEKLVDIFKYKYKNKRLDAIIVSNSEALDFVIKHRDELFYGTPVVFTDVKHIDPALLLSENWITGVLEQELDEIIETIDVALQLHPDTTQLVLLSPGSKQAILTRQLHEKYGDKVDIVINNESFMSDIEKSVKELPANSVILTTAEPRTKTGEIVPYYLLNERVASISHIPVYGISDTGFGAGIVGGKLISGIELGRDAARMVIGIF